MPSTPKKLRAARPPSEQQRNAAAAGGRRHSSGGGGGPQQQQTPDVLGMIKVLWQAERALDALVDELADAVHQKQVDAVRLVCELTTLSGADDTQTANAAAEELKCELATVEEHMRQIDLQRTDAEDSVTQL